MAWIDEWTQEQRDWLALQVRTSRERQYPKRTRFVKTLDGVGESTVQVIEGTKNNNVAPHTVNYVTMKLGWPDGFWRQVMEQHLEAPEESEVEVLRREVERQALRIAELEHGSED